MRDITSIQRTYGKHVKTYDKDQYYQAAILKGTFLRRLFSTKVFRSS